MELLEALHDATMTPEVRLGLKVGVGVGAVTMFYVGGYAGRCEYFAAGRALKQSFDAAELCRSGDAIVSSEVWGKVNSCCAGSALPGGYHVVKAMQQAVRKRSITRTIRLTARQLDPKVHSVLRGYAPPTQLQAAALEAEFGQSLRSWTVSVVQASVLFIRFGVGTIMDTEALDLAKVHNAVVVVQARSTASDLERWRPRSRDRTGPAALSKRRSTSRRSVASSTASLSMIRAV